jgi:hypothetical protein
MFKKDNLRFGIIIGLIAPILAMGVYYLVSFRNSLTIHEYLYVLKTNKTLITGISSISLLANAILFTIYINGRRDSTGKGIFVSTLVYGIFVLLFKLFS